MKEFTWRVLIDSNDATADENLSRTAVFKDCDNTGLEDSEGRDMGR